MFYVVKKGVLVYPSVYGNIVIGPTAEDQKDRDTATIEDVFFFFVVTI
jgi:glycerol-3-phosphate dehydrogenase